MIPKVTVLMPVFNASAYISEAIDSILGQTFKDFEFLIIDDGSVDETVPIIRSYKDTRIRLLINESNRGIAETLNRGIVYAACELIARMDADDISYPRRIEKQFEYMQTHPGCALLSTWARVVTAEREPLFTERHRHSYYYYNLNFECWIYHPTVMYRKSIVMKEGMYQIPHSEDYDLFWRLTQKYPVHNLDEPLLDYRLSPTSLNTVLKKAEYDDANRHNVIRNLKRYMGDDFSMREEYLECLRHNFSPILALNSVTPIIDCLRILDQINESIIRTPNVNLHRKQTREAAWHKKDFILEQLASHLSPLERVALSLRARKPGLLYRKVYKALRWRFNFMREKLRLEF